VQVYWEAVVVVVVVVVNFVIAVALYTNGMLISVRGAFFNAHMRFAPQCWWLTKFQCHCHIWALIVTGSTSTTANISDQSKASYCWLYVKKMHLIKDRYANTRLKA